MIVEVSLGELIDKYSILEIKKNKLVEDEKRNEILKELSCLEEAKKYINKSKFFYKLLLWVNTSIWDKTNIIKSLSPHDSEYASISFEIFELNQKRFRIKNIFNTMFFSELKEQKSYAQKHCNIKIENEDTFFRKLSEINYIALEFDTISFECNFINIINKIYTTSNVLYNNIPVIYDSIDLENYTLDHHLRDIFDFEPLYYLSGGRIGDFIHQLSIVYEKFRTTGRKAIIHISNTISRSEFQFGIENAYNDTKDILALQYYIKDYKIQESNTKIVYDYNLSEWRDSPILWKSNWYEVFKNWYNIDWAAHKWLTLPIYENWSDKIVVSCSYIRLPTIDFNIIHNKYKDIIYIAQNMNEYTTFINRVKINLPVHIVKNYFELACVINSCKLYIGNLSSPLALAHSFHKNAVVLFCKGHPDNILMKDIPVLNQQLEFYE